MPAERRAHSSQSFRTREVRRAHSSGRRAVRLATTASAFIVICAFAPAGSAGALGLPMPFRMSPSSGPPGTKVHVSGDGCSPGLLFGSSFVTIEVSTVPPTRSLRIPAQTDGSWRGSFTIPANARPAPAVVTATCVSDGFLSLLTTYTPRTFDVTGSLAPTTEASTVRTVPGAPSTIASSDPGIPAGPDTSTPPASSQVSVPSTRPDTGTPLGGSEPGGGGGAAAGAGTTTIAATAPGKRGTAAPRARAAELTSPELSVSKGDNGSGLGWLLWLITSSVPVGGVALYTWMRRARRTRVPEVGADSA